MRKSELESSALSMKAYLQVDEIIDWKNPAITNLAKQLASECPTVLAIARACFGWVRDAIYHSADYQMNPLTWDKLFQNLPDISLDEAKIYGLDNDS